MHRRTERIRIPSLPRFLHKRSLTAALFTLLMSLLTAVFYSTRPLRPDWIGLMALASMNFTAWFIAGWNLLQDVERGYSPSKSSLAAVILLFSAVPMAFAGLVLLNFLF